MIHLYCVRARDQCLHTTDCALQLSWGRSQLGIALAGLSRQISLFLNGAQRRISDVQERIELNLRWCTRGWCFAWWAHTPFEAVWFYERASEATYPLSPRPCAAAVAELQSQPQAIIKAGHGILKSVLPARREQSVALPSILNSYQIDFSNSVCFKVSLKRKQVNNVHISGWHLSQLIRIRRQKRKKRGCYSLV